MIFKRIKGPVDTAYQKGNYIIQKYGKQWLIMYNDITIISRIDKLGQAQNIVDLMIEWRLSQPLNSIQDMKSWSEDVRNFRGNMLELIKRHPKVDCYFFIHE